MLYQQAIEQLGELSQEDVGLLFSEQAGIHSRPSVQVLVERTATVMPLLREARFLDFCDWDESFHYGWQLDLVDGLLDGFNLALVEAMQPMRQAATGEAGKSGAPDASFGEDLRVAGIILIGDDIKIGLEEADTGYGFVLALGEERRGVLL